MPNETYTVEPAREADRESVTRLIRASHFDARALNMQYFIIARNPAGQVLGCGQCKPVGGRPVLGSIVVDPSCRGQGIGRAVIQTLLSRERGPVYLMCIGPLVTFYRGVGFQPASFRRAPMGLTWRWAVLSVLGRILPEYAGMTIMVRPASVPDERRGAEAADDLG